MSDPLVSVIIPAYNKSELTVRTVKSVLSQTYRNLEIIVVDDGSTDDTALRMKRFGSQIRYFKKPNGGACSARNVGIEASAGELIALLDCDDTYEPAKIERAVEYFSDHPEVGMVHTAAIFIDEQEREIGVYSHKRSKVTGQIFERLVMGNFICNSTPVIRRQCFDELNLFDENIFAPADWQMWMRIAKKFPIGYIDEPLTRYFVTDNYTFRHLEECRREEQYVLDMVLEDGYEDLKNRVYANHHLRYAQCYLLMCEIDKMKKEFMECLRRRPVFPKAWAHALLYGVARPWLVRTLTQRILRHG